MAILYLLDTANTEAIARLCELYPIHGVTTNPSHIARERRPFRQLVGEIRRIIGPERPLFVQVLSADAEGMLAEARALVDLLGETCCPKVPVTPQGLKAIRLMRAAGIKPLATAVFTVQQAVVAARAGARWVAPYVNQLDGIQVDGTAVVAEMVRTLRHYGLEAEVMAASFRTPEQVLRCCLAGAAAATVSPEVFEALVAHPLTDRNVARFAADWEAVYGQGRTTLDASVVED